MSFLFVLLLAGANSNLDYAAPILGNHHVEYNSKPGQVLSVPFTYSTPEQQPKLICSRVISPSPSIHFNPTFCERTQTITNNIHTVQGLSPYKTSLSVEIWFEEPKSNSATLKISQIPTPPPISKLILQSSGFNIVQTKYGAMTIYSDDMEVGQHLLEFGQWEDDVLSLLSLFIRPGDVVFEGGSHIGSHTIAFSKMVGSGGHVHCFEPHYANRGILYSNIVLNEMLEVTSVHDVALSNSTNEPHSRILLGNGANILFDEQLTVGDGKKANSGSFCFKDQPLAHNHGEGSGSDSSSGRSVRIASFDQQFENNELLSRQCPRVIKTDLEGMDVWAIQGAREILKLCQPVIYLEAHAPMKEAYRNLRKFFLDNELMYQCYYDSFRVIPLRGTTYYESEIGEFDSRRGAVSFNFLCVNRGTEEDFRISEEVARLLPGGSEPDFDSVYCWVDWKELGAQLVAEGFYDVVVGKGGDKRLCKR